eukprot:2665850-Amphidinium_carterae.2
MRSEELSQLMALIFWQKLQVTRKRDDDGAGRTRLEPLVSDLTGGDMASFKPCALRKTLTGLLQAA